MHASSHFLPDPRDAHRARLSAACVRWLLLGSALVVLLPAARGSSVWIGWLPYWLCVAPAMCLLLLEHRSIKRAAQRSLRAGFARPGLRRRQARRHPSGWSMRSLSLAGLLGQ